MATSSGISIDFITYCGTSNANVYSLNTLIFLHMGTYSSLLFHFHEHGSRHLSTGFLSSFPLLSSHWSFVCIHNFHNTYLFKHIEKWCSINVISLLQKLHNTWLLEVWRDSVVGNHNLLIINIWHITNRTDTETDKTFFTNCILLVEIRPCAVYMYMFCGSKQVQSKSPDPILNISCSTCWPSFPLANDTITILLTCLQ